MNERPVRFTDSQVAHILKRAAEIDARGDSMSADDLRAIAAEAGIDPGATDVAIQELLAEEEDRSPTLPEPGSAVAEKNPQLPARRVGPSLPWRVAAGGAVGAACGLIYGPSARSMLDILHPATDGAMASALIGLGTAALYLIARGVPSMKRGDQRGFQIENLAVWIGAALGTIPQLVPLFFIDDILAPLFVAWFLVAVIGGLLMRLGAKEQVEPDKPARIGAGAGCSRHVAAPGKRCMSRGLRTPIGHKKFRYNIMTP